MPDWCLYIIILSAYHEIILWAYQRSSYAALISVSTTTAKPSLMMHCSSHVRSSAWSWHNQWNNGILTLRYLRVRQNCLNYMEWHELPSNVWSLLYMLIKLPHVSRVYFVKCNTWNTVKKYTFQIVWINVTRWSAMHKTLALLSAKFSCSLSSL